MKFFLSKLLCFLLRIYDRKSNLRNSVNGKTASDVFMKIEERKLNKVVNIMYVQSTLIYIQKTHFLTIKEIRKVFYNLCNYGKKVKII